MRSERPFSLPRWSWAVWPGLVAVFLRVHGITDLDLFVDEGANIFTALDGRVRVAFEPLEQGRPWLVHLFRPAGWVPEHALTVARLMAGGSALVTMGALAVVCVQLAQPAAAKWAVWLWAVLPFAVWHERFALQDPFVTAALAAALALGLTASREDARYPAATMAAAGLAIGVAFLLKISALVALPWMAVIGLGASRLPGYRRFGAGLGWAAGGAAALVVASLGTGLPKLGSSLGRYHAPPDLGADAVSAAFERLHVWLGWYFGFGGWALVALIAWASAAAARSGGIVLWLGGAWLLSVPVGSFVFTNHYERYALPDHAAMVLFVACAVAAPAAGRWRWAAAGAGAAALAMLAWASLRIARDPARAPVPEASIRQYVTGPWSGLGVRELRDFLIGYADRNRTRCFVITPRFMSPGSYGLMLASLADSRLGVVPRTVEDRAKLERVLATLGAVSGGENAAVFYLLENRHWRLPEWLDTPSGPTQPVCTVVREGETVFSLYRAGLAPDPK